MKIEDLAERIRQAADHAEADLNDDRADRQLILEELIETIRNLADEVNA